MRLTIPTLALAALAPAAAVADACDTVKAAYDALAAAPAIAQTMTMAGAPTMRMVTMGDTLYIDEGAGTWTKMALPVGARAQMMASVLPDAAALKDCVEAGTETLDGAEMTVIEYTPPAIGGIEQGPQKVWIDAEGRPRRMISVEAGALDMTISYQDVTAPVE